MRTTRKKLGLSLTWLAGAGAVAALVAVGACGSDDTTPSNADAPDGGGPGDGPLGNPEPDTGVPPAMAQGDPCRGVPVPPDQAYVPAGLCARVVASNVTGGLRQIAFAPNGDL